MEPKRVLMIVYHFPPFRGSSGLQRPLSFSRYLPDYGWEPIVLTIHPRAYPEVGDVQFNEIPRNLHVARAFALDTGRHLAFRGAYPDWLGIPDRWVSWLIGAIPLGLRLIRQYRPKVLWSTYPIATAHLIGATLCRLTGIPWIADFRDPMVEYDAVKDEYWPRDPRVRRARSWIERLVVRYGTHAVFASCGARRIYTERFPEVPEDRWTIIPNGYDEENFLAAEQHQFLDQRVHGQLVLLHSGILYPTPDRDPTAFCAALAELRDAGHISPATLKIIFRATGHDDHYCKLLTEYQLQEMVFLAPSIPYRDALSEMLHVDGLLLFQGYLSNPAIPAKLYEYLRAQRPILALVDADGDTASALRSLGLSDSQAPLDNKQLIKEHLMNFLHRVRQGTVSIARMSDVARFSRRALTRQLGVLLDEILPGGKMRV
ncbi:MAG: glycosyltransferase [Candidatus Binatia bacterium]